MKKLAEYNKKREFDKTQEPKGEVSKKKSKKLVYIVQHHMASKEHYDFRLEWGGVLLSWAVPKGPSLNPADKRLAVQVEDHPVSYANFEGVIPQGQYGGGTVMLWDKGHWEGQENFEQSLKSGNFKFELFGQKMKGKFALIRLKSDKKQENWLLIKDNDEFANKKFKIGSFDTSIKTNRTMSEIAQNKKQKAVKTSAKNPFSSVKMQLLELTTQVPTGEVWIYEMKYDGYRIVCFYENGKAKFVTRNNINYTSKFESLKTDIENWAKNSSFVLDGEVIVADQNGNSNFGLLQEFLSGNNNLKPTYVVFDLLALNGQDLRKQSLQERKASLKKLVKNAPKSIVYSMEIKGDGNEIFQNACNLNAEGIVAKNKFSQYSGTRSPDWKKIKCSLRQEFVVGGYGQKKKDLSSLLLGYYDNDQLIYVGKVGTGFDQKQSKTIIKQLEKLITDKNFFNKKIKQTKDEEVIFVLPSLVAEVQFLSLTKDGLLRHASFKGLRKDKTAKEVKLENIRQDKQSKKEKEKFKTEAHQQIKLTSPDKVIYKKQNIKKQDVFNYYKQAAKRMMPFLQDRLVSLKRCPQGTHSMCFFERNYNSIMGSGVLPLYKTKNAKHNYFYIENENGLLYQAQLNTIEFHIWCCKKDALTSPDIMTFDIDPDDKMPIEKVRQAAKDLKSILDKLDLTSFIKTSGGKGFHILVPFSSKTSWQKFSAFAKNMALIMEEKWPDKYTSNIRKEARKGKIFIDWVRNTKSSTSVAPYSLRVKDTPTVSMPISWRELNSVSPDSIKIEDALKRLKKADPWKNFFEIEQGLD